MVEIDVAAGPESHWIRDVTTRWPVRLRIRVCRPMGSKPTRLLQLAELAGAPGDVGAVERHLRRAPGLDELTTLVLSPSRRLLRVVSPLPDGCRKVFEMGAICSACRFLPMEDPRKGDRWSLVVPRDPSTLRAIASLRAAPGETGSPIIRMRRFRPPRSLTPRQAAALETAHRLGYYAFPRRTNLREIARILGITRSTTAELLRRAEGKMLAADLAGT